MSSVEFEIVTLEYGPANNNRFAIVLKEREGSRKLKLTLSGLQAQSIAIKLEGLDANIQLTHDLIKVIFDELGAELESVIIKEIREGIYYSALQCKLNDRYVEINSRTSDALALAVRFDCPIYATKHVADSQSNVDFSKFEEIGEDDLVERNSQSRKLEDFPMHKLKEMMKEKLKAEDYEEAARIRDAIKSKNS